MYRQPAERDAGDDAPSELVYPFVDRGPLDKPVLALVVCMSGLVVMAGLIAELGFPNAALASVLVGIGAAFAWWRRGSVPQEVLLRIEGDVLHVRVPRARARDAWIKLDDLSEVALDTKTIRRMHEGQSAIPALRFAESRVGPELDRARIVLVDRTGRPVLPLTDAYFPHIEASEWFGKIRVFLRKHGWVPDDERDEESGPPSSEP